MGLFSSKDDIPEIMPMPSAPKILPKKEEKKSELPSIPGGDKINDNLNNEMIKSALSESYTESYEEPEEIEEEDSEERFKNQRVPLPPSYPKRESEPIQKDETIFIKIDKFNNSKKALHDIEEKVLCLSDEIAKLKEIKNQEIKELESWDEELKKVNIRLSRIDSNIFGEV